MADNAMAAYWDLPAISRYVNDHLTRVLVYILLTIPQKPSHCYSVVVPCL